jgi:hypothetical protein
LIRDTTDLVFFGLVGAPLMIALALMPFATIERFHNKRGFTVPSHRTVVVVRTMAGMIAVWTTVSALLYLTGLQGI